MDKIYVDYNSLKNNKLKELENVACDEMIKKVNELQGIVDSIEKNWQGSNANRYRKEINDIIDAINNFKHNCIEKNIIDIDTQIGRYQNNEEME